MTLQPLKEKEERVRAETEARYAKAERDRLKKQLYLLTAEKTKIQKDEEALAAVEKDDNTSTGAEWLADWSFEIGEPNYAVVESETDLDYQGKE